VCELIVKTESPSNLKKRYRNHPLILIPLSNGVLPERLLVGDNMSKAHTGNPTTFFPSEKQKRNI
jgi:hypothetical protein